MAAVPAQALPVVNMEKVLLAAQIDPRRPDSALTPGAKDHVLAVEQALQAKGFLAAQYVDGHFGTTTTTAYTNLQKSFGWTGLDTNGIPGETSLKRLGEGRFTVTAIVSAGSRITHQGKTINTRTKAMLDEAETRLGRTLTITQGSYNVGGDPDSAGTHDGGGALDISVNGMDNATRTDVVRKLREVGFAAWLRTPSQGNWPYHIHAMAVSDPHQSPAAWHQSGDYYLGKNGLANRGPDDGPSVTKRTWEEVMAR
ncbi:peptidoglycan-binding protein [Kibdelosporangium philippinense]|uniref:Peptidoglycan-binding protein n=2 Tax=Kibdelosporangium philippinense TaxID=211113 RepID=A0ABS8Z8V8_9PSEU|nr:peptidoglycan-binding protein [Kibdelosporangium philippinense]MCE7003962.1 peptidoglycan-binding protein [Kibdelosporangium philippinense]